MSLPAYPSGRTPRAGVPLPLPSPTIRVRLVSRMSERVPRADDGDYRRADRPPAYPLLVLSWQHLTPCRASPEVARRSSRPAHTMDHLRMKASFWLAGTDPHQRGKLHPPEPMVEIGGQRDLCTS